jgi:hypothetical protein
MVKISIKRAISWNFLIFQHVSLAYIDDVFFFVLIVLTGRDKQLTGQVCFRDMREGSRIFYKENVNKHRRNFAISKELLLTKTVDDI